MVGLRQVDQFEVKRKRPGQQNRPFRRQFVHQLQCSRRIAGGFFALPARLCVPAPDGALPQRLHFCKKLLAGLLAQHLAQQHAQRPHIAPQRRLLQVAGLRFQLSQPLRPALGIPQKGHRLLIMHDRM